MIDKKLLKKIGSDVAKGYLEDKDYVARRKEGDSMICFVMGQQDSHKTLVVIKPRRTDISWDKLANGLVEQVSVDKTLGELAGIIKVDVVGNRVTYSIVDMACNYFLGMSNYNEETKRLNLIKHDLNGWKSVREAKKSQLYDKFLLNILTAYSIYRLKQYGNKIHTK